MRRDEIGEVPCSVARTLSVIGDRWTLLVLRDAFLRTRRFEDFQRQLGVTRHLLADRLKKLVAEDILLKVRYQEKPARCEYRLTRKGRDLHPVIVSLVGGVIYKPYYLLPFALAALVVFRAPQTWDFTRSLSTWKAFTCFGLLVLALVALTTQEFNPFIYFIF